MFSFFTKDNLLVLAIIVVVVYLSYENALPNAFTFDDHLAIENNGDVTQQQANLTHIWLDDLWGKDLRAKDSHKSYRPLLIELFRFLWHLQPSAGLYRAVNMVFHGVSTYLMYALSVCLLGDRLIALGAAALFASHPVHVEAITAVVNMAEPLCSILIIIAYLCYRRSGLLHGLLWVLATVTAVLVKETGIIAALLVLATVISRLVVRVLVKITLPAAHGARMRCCGLGDLLWVTASTGAVYLYFGLRHVLTHSQRDDIFSSWSNAWYHMLTFLADREQADYLGSSELLRRAENPFAFLHGLPKVLSTLHLYVRYVGVLLWPAEQAPEYSFDCIPAVQGWEDPRNLWAAALVLAVVLAVGWSIVRAYKMEYAAAMRDAVGEGRDPAADPAVGSASSAPSAAPSSAAADAPLTSTETSAYQLIDALLWLLVAFLPASGIVFTLGTLLAERLLYLPSYAFCLLFAWFMHSLIGHSSTVRKAGYLLVITIVVSAYVRRCREYNTKWADDSALFKHTVSVCPNSAKSHLQVSKLYSMQGDLQLSWAHLKRSQEIDPAFCDHGFQEAYLTVMEANALQTAGTHGVRGEDLEEHNDLIDRAVHFALDNLQCIYTNKQAVDLLTKLWAYQLDTGTKMNKPLHKIHTEHAKQCYKYSLFNLAAKKYIDLSVAVFDLPDHKVKAMSFATMANKALQKHYNQSDTPVLTDAAVGQELSGERLMTYMLQCRVWTLLAAMSQATSSKPAPAVRLQWMASGAGRGCLYVAKQLSEGNALEHVKIAANQYIMLMQNRLDAKNHTQLHEYSTILMTSLSLDSGLPVEEEDWTPSPFQKQLAQHWHTLGASYYKAKNYPQSAQHYALALLTVLPIQSSAYADAVLAFAGQKAAVTEHVSFWHKHNVSMWEEQDTSILEDCMVLYWYADSLAGLPEIYSELPAVQLILSFMEQYKRCITPRAAQREQLPVVEMLIDKFTNHSMVMHELEVKQALEQQTCSR